MRPLAYPGSDVVLLVFSLGDPASFEALQYYWMPELSRFLPHTPIVLVACKVDLRDDEDTLRQLGEAPVSESKVVL